MDDENVWLDLGEMLMSISRKTSDTPKYVVQNKEQMGFVDWLRQEEIDKFDTTAAAIEAWCKGHEPTFQDWHERHFVRRMSEVAAILALIVSDTLENRPHEDALKWLLQKARLALETGLHEAPATFARRP